MTPEQEKALHDALDIRRKACRVLEKMVCLASCSVRGDLRSERRTEPVTHRKPESGGIAQAAGGGGADRSSRRSQRGSKRPQRLSRCDLGKLRFFHVPVRFRRGRCDRGHHNQRLSTAKDGSELCCCEPRAVGQRLWGRPGRPVDHTRSYVCAAAAITAGMHARVFAYALAAQRSYSCVNDILIAQSRHTRAVGTTGVGVVLCVMANRGPHDRDSRLAYHGRLRLAPRPA
jgi:hypothetical protein